MIGIRGRTDGLSGSFYFRAPQVFIIRLKGKNTPAGTVFGIDGWSFWIVFVFRFVIRFVKFRIRAIFLLVLRFCINQFDLINFKANSCFLGLRGCA